MRQSAMQKNWCILFKVKVTVRVYIIKIRLQPNLLLWYIIISWSGL